MKKFDEDKIIDVLAVVAIFAFIFFMRWLMSVPRAYENNENETIQVVENSVEIVENVYFETETIEKPYTENEMIITAYCPCEKCCGVYATNRHKDKDGNDIVLTASGKEAKAGRTVAVDPRYIPYGTEIIIDGQTYIAEDCGGAIKGDRIDIYFDSHSEAVSFGKQTKIVRVMK